MSGLNGSVLLPSAFTAADSARVTSILSQLAETVHDTRKGRNWECVVAGTVVTISVQSTEKHDYDYETLLLQHSLQFNDAPEAFLIACGHRNPRAREWCCNLAARLADEFGGIDCGFRD